jgi:hypothetical protein
MKRTTENGDVDDFVVELIRFGLFNVHNFLCNLPKLCRSIQLITSEQI